MGNCQWPEQLLTTLLDNASPYTPQGGHIQLAAPLTQQRILLKVSDDGLGIPPEQRKRIFDRFYRGDLSRSKKEHGRLVLSIAKEPAALHGGNLYLEPHSGSGATFVLELPGNYIHLHPRNIKIVSVIKRYAAEVIVLRRTFCQHDCIYFKEYSTVSTIFCVAAP